MNTLNGYDKKTITVLGKDNATQTYTGVSYNKLLNDTAPTGDATMVNMTGSDGYTNAIALSKIRGLAGRDHRDNVGQHAKVCHSQRVQGSLGRQPHTLIVLE